MCFDCFGAKSTKNETPDKKLGSSSSSSSQEPVKSYPMNIKEKNGSQLTKDQLHNGANAPANSSNYNSKSPPKEDVGGDSRSNLDAKNEKIDQPFRKYSSLEDQLQNDKKSNNDELPKKSPAAEEPPPPKEQEAAGHRDSTRQVLSSNFDEQNEKMLSSTRTTTDQPSTKSENQFDQHTVVNVSTRSSDKKSNKEQPPKEHPRPRRVSNLDTKNEEMFTPSSDQPASDSNEDRPTYLK